MIVSKQKFMSYPGLIVARSFQPLYCLEILCLEIIMIILRAYIVIEFIEILKMLLEIVGSFLFELVIHHTSVVYEQADKQTNKQNSKRLLLFL